MSIEPQTNLVEPDAPASVLVLPREIERATQACLRADAELQVAEARLGLADSLVQWEAFRLYAAPFGLPPWGSGLIAGSVAAFVACVGMILVGVAGPLFIAMFCALGYALIGLSVFWAVRDQSDEERDHRQTFRREELKQAKAQRHLVSSTVDAANTTVRHCRERLEELRAIANSALNKLLAVEPGRLYPDELERFAGDIFQHLGYDVKRFGKAGDQGVDVIASKTGLKLAIQVKCDNSDGTIENSAVQQVFAGMAHYECDRCMVFTNSSFSPAAIALASSIDCQLIDRFKIRDLIESRIELP